MKAVTFTSYGGPEVMQHTEVPKPTIKPLDVLVQNKAIGVNPIDFKIRQGLFGAPIGPDNPLIVGWDGAGVIVEVGEDVSGLAVGDEVYYAGDVGRAGSYAELTAVDSRVVAKKPTTMSFEQAAAIPLVAETAWETLVEDFAAEPGQSILIVNGAGGVGSFAVQLAKARGLTVIASASREESKKWVKKLGADHVIAHGRSAKPLKEELAAVGFEDGVDFIFHLHNPTGLAEKVAVLKPLGQIALTWAASPEEMAALDGMDMFFKRKALRYTLMFARLGQGVKPEMQGQLLGKVASLIDSGKIAPIDTKTMSWMDVAEAHIEQEEGKRVGKTVLTI